MVPLRPGRRAARSRRRCHIQGLTNELRAAVVSLTAENRVVTPREKDELCVSFLITREHPKLETIELTKANVARDDVWPLTLNLDSSLFTSARGPCRESGRRQPAVRGRPSTTEYRW